MPHYSVRLDLRSNKPLGGDQIAELKGGKHEVVAIGQPRGRRLALRLTMDGGDVVGALARALNYVLDQVPGEVHHAEVTATKPARATRAP